MGTTLGNGWLVSMNNLNNDILKNGGKKWNDLLTSLLI